MFLLITCILFLLVTAGLAYVGNKLWVRPGEAFDRVTGVAVQNNYAEQMPMHPALSFREMLEKLGTMLPSSPKDVSIMQRRLIKAGIRSPNALKMLYGWKAFLTVLLVVLAGFATASSEGMNKPLLILVAGCVGFFGPNQYVNSRIKKRSHEIARGLPNALDLLVVSVESGLGLDQAIVQVAKDLEHAHPEICEEFALVNLELKAGNRRVDALRNLADRSSVDDLKKLVAVLIQADRFGTGIAASLRGHADYMRVQARQIAEEKAAKLGVKLVFPIFFCILPTLFVVTVGPVIVRIMRELIPMMNNM